MLITGCPITSVFFLGSLVASFLGSLVSFFLGSLVSLLLSGSNSLVHGPFLASPGLSVWVYSLLWAFFRAKPSLVTQELPHL